MWEPFVKSERTLDVSLLEFDSIVSTLPKGVEGLREHIKTLINSVDREDTLIFVTKVLESDRHMASKSSMTTTDCPDCDTTTATTTNNNNHNDSNDYNNDNTSGTTTSSAPETPTFAPNSHPNSINIAKDERPIQCAGSAREIIAVTREREGRKKEIGDGGGGVDGDGGGGKANVSKIGMEEKVGGVDKKKEEEEEIHLPPTPLVAAGGKATYSYGRRAAVSAESLPLHVIQGYTPPIVAKSLEEERLVRAGVASCHLFSNMDRNDQAIIVNALQREVYPAGTDILKQDGISSEKLFLITRGSCEVIKNGKLIHVLNEGSTFGEMEMIYNLSSCVATIRSVTKCTLYTLDQITYQHIVLTVSLQKRKKYQELLQYVKFLSFFSDYDRMQIAEGLVSKVYKQGDYIIRFGENCKWLHIIEEGEVTVIGRQSGKRCEIIKRRRGHIVGELEFLFHNLATADVIVTSKKVVTAQIKRKHFELITGPIQDQLKEYIINSGIYTHYLQEANDQVKAELSLLGKRSKRLATKEEREHTQLEHVSIHGEIIIPVKKEKIFPLEKCVQGHEENVKGTHSTTSNNINDHNNDSITNETDDKNVLEKEANSSSSLSSSGHHVLSRFPLMLLHTHFLAMIALCEDGSILLWNDMMTSLTGYSSEQVVGQHICSFLLGTKDQKAMHQALCDARRYTGDAEMFLEEKGISCRKIYTFAKIDGLTKVLIKLCILPPIVSHGKDAVEIMLAVGAEHHYNHGSKRVLDKSHVLINKVSSILRDGESSYEDRVHAISSVLSRFDTTYRLMTTCMEDVHHINIRQMIGQIIMDYGTQCVANGVSVCQRFEDIYAENVYVNSRLLPECLRYAMSNCAKHLKEAIVIITLKIEEAKKNRSEEHENSESNNNNDNENMIEFLSIEFHDNGPGFPLDFLQHFHKKIFLPEEKYSHIHYIYKCMEQQGGDIIIDSVPGNTSIRFIIPFIPIDTHHHHSQSDADDVHPPLKYPRSPLDNSLNSMDHHNHNNNNNNDDNNNDTADESKTTSESHYSVQSGKDIPMGKQTFTTLVVEDVPAHRNMLCSFLWESKHAVLPAYNLDDIEQLIDVVDILFIDPHQSIFEESNNIVDPITLLREKARRMAIVITGVDIDKESEKAYHTAGFITLKKPCNPKQARLCIRKAEEMIYQYKVEAERIVQTRETFSKNSRGAWKRGKLLGKGMFGEVYEATEILTGGKMAVKEMKVGGHDLHTEQFVNEISTMCNLQHPNIIHYFYCEENKEKGVIRVFMEYASGGNVQQLLHRKNKLDFKEYQSLLRDIVEGVIYIHSMGYVHGDLKTANILLSGEGKGKIGDFGTARRVRQDELLYQMQGSPLYMSPECMSAGDRDEDGLLIGYSFPSDVWSLGCIALEMATNRPPFSHLKNVKGPLGLMNYITELHDTPDLSPLFSGPPSIVEFVSACLNPDPSKRATVAELIHMSIFSETNDEDMKSALRALKRAQLLHVLNNFVAFQEPEDLARRRSHAYSRLLVRETEFFESSFDDKDTGHEDEKNEEEENGNNNEEGTQTNKKKKHILWEETSNFIPVDDDNARNSSNVGGNSPGEEMLPMRRSCTKSKSMTRSSRRFDEDAFFETSSSSCASSPRNEAHGGDASKKNRDDNDDGCAEEKNIFQWRTNENDWRKSLSGGASSFVMNRRSIAFLGRTIDNVGVSVNVEAFPHETQEQPASKAGQEEGKEEEEEEESHSPPHAGSLCRGALTQPFDHAHRGSASSKLSPSRQRRRGMKNMFLVEDHSSGSAERCGAGPTSPRIKTTTSSAALPPLRTRGYGSFQRQRRFAAAPQMSSPSPVTPAWAVDDHLQSAGTPSSPNYGGTKKEVASLGRELAALQHAVVEMERRLRELGPNASQETWQPYLHEPSKTVVSGGEILSRGNSSQATEEENETMNSVASIRELLGRVEKGVINLKSFIPSE